MTTTTIPAPAKTDIANTNVFSPGGIKSNVLEVSSASYSVQLDTSTAGSVMLPKDAGFRLTAATNTSFQFGGSGTPTVFGLPLSEGMRFDAGTSKSSDTYLHWQASTDNADSTKPSYLFYY